LSGDPVLSLDSIAWAFFIAIVAFSTFKAFAIRHALFSGLYRTRALWTGVLGFVAVFHAILLLLYASGVINFPVPPANIGIPSIIPTFVFQFADYATFLTLVILVVALTDSSIRVALDRDFFHRDTLNWRGLRFAVYAVSIIFDATRFLSLFPPSDLSDVASNTATAAFAVVVFFAAANLVVSGNRVKDRPIRMYNLYLGIAVFLFIVTVVLFALPPPIDYLEFVAIVLAGFFVFKMTTSLSPTNRIGKEVTIVRPDVSIV
jgi:hypothetical protein